MKTAWDLIRQTVGEFLDDQCLRMAAALSYYTVFSLPALLVVLISLTSLAGVDRQDISGRLTDEFDSVVGAEGAEQVQTMIDHANKPGRGLWGTIIGAVVLLFGATGVMIQLQDALNEAWDVERPKEAGGVKNFILKRLLSLGMILALAFLLLVSLVASMVLSAVGDQLDRWLPGDAGNELLGVADVLISYVAVAALFATLFKFLPDREVAWGDVWLGAVVTALLFVLAKWGLGLYLGKSDVASTYGAAGSLALILLWIYYSSAVFLLGAEFTQVWARRHETAGERARAGEREVAGFRPVGAGRIGKHGRLS